MKTKLVNKKVIFALVMSLALVLSYSSFAFATDTVNTDKVKKEAAEARQAAYEELQEAKQKVADLEANKGLSKETMRALDQVKAAELAKKAADKKLEDAMKAQKEYNEKAEEVKTLESAKGTAAITLRDVKAEKAAIEAANPVNDQNPESVDALNKALADAGFPAKLEDAQKAYDNAAQAHKDAEEELAKMDEVKDSDIDALKKDIEDAQKKLEEAQKKFNDMKADEIKAAQKVVKRLQIALAEVEQLIQDINDGKSIDPQVAKKIIDNANKAAADAKASKDAPKANGPQTADAQDLVAYVLGLAMVSAGAVYTFRKRNLNK